MISANHDHPVRLDAGENPHQGPAVNNGDRYDEPKGSSADQSSRPANESLETKASDRAKIVALMIGFLVLLLLIVVFHKKEPSEEHIQHLKDELREKDELIKILAEGYRSQKGEDSESGKKKRPFRFLHVVDRVVVWVMIIIGLSFGITYWICANACQDQQRDEGMSPIEALFAPVIKVIVITAMGISFLVLSAYTRIKELLGKDKD